MGRWSTIKLQGKQNKYIAIVTAYRVAQSSITQCGPYTAFAQQWHHAKRNNVSSPQPRNDTLNDLQKYIQAQQNQHGDIILAIDANAHVMDNNQQLATWIANLGLIDIHTHLHDSANEPPTHIRGSKRIDYIFCSPPLIPYIIHAGILPFAQFIQYGSRNNKSTHDALTFKHFTYGISRLTKTNLLSFDNDAKACYDRIVLLFGMLCSRQLGMPSKVCNFFVHAYEKLNYHIQTAYGLSQQYYKHTPNTPIHGPGQGNHSSPSLWVLISSLLMSCMEEKASGLELCDPTQQ